MQWRNFPYLRFCNLEGAFWEVFGSCLLCGCLKAILWAWGSFSLLFGFLFRKQIIGRIRPSAGTGIAAACRRPASDGYHSFGHWDTAEAFFHARFAARFCFMAKVPFFGCGERRF
nr:hypothetical protein [Bacillaceae bacterium]